MTERATQLKLAVDVGSDPITGSVVVAGGDPRSFCGWIELVAEIEAARHNGGRVGAGVADPSWPEKRLG